MKEQIFPRLVTDAVLAGATVEFWFAAGANTREEAYQKGFKRVANVIGTTPQMETQAIETMGSFRGRRTLIKHTETSRRRIYQLDNNVLDLQALEIEMRASKGEDFTQEAYAAEEVDAFAFTAGSPSQSGVGYPLTDDGVRVRHVSAVTIDSGGSPLVEGTDFRVDKEHGLVFFLTEQTASATPTVTADAIDAESEKFEFGLNPDDVQHRAGYGSIYIYDLHAGNRIHHRHEDFSCIIRPGDATQRDGESEEARTQILVEVTEDAGNVYVRRANAPEGYSD